jgi:type I restriction enzyme, S subunit
MQSEWKRVTIGEITNRCLGKMLDKNKNRGDLHPYLGNSNVRWGTFELQSLAEMRFENHEHERYGVKSGDLIVCEGGEPGRCAIWKEYRPNMKIQKALHRVRAKNGLDIRYLHYWLLQAGEIGTLDQYFTGTTIKHLTGKALALVELMLPPLIEQKRIASILSSLDDKIELNRKMNETLEAMAQAMFKSWFVDFDPVIDNILLKNSKEYPSPNLSQGARNDSVQDGSSPSGRGGGEGSIFDGIPEELKARAEQRKDLGDKRKQLPKEIQQLFPSEFKFTDEMGWIPLGWKISSVGEEYNVTMGQSPPGSTYNNTGNGIPFFQGSTDFGFRYPSNRIHCTEPKRFASICDTLISVRAPVGDTNMAHSDCCIGRGVAAAKHNSGSRSFTYYSMLQLKEHFNKFEAEGTVFGSINQKDFRALRVYNFDSELVREFEQRAGCLDQKIEICSKNIRELTKLRNTLLPKLLSGELRIKDVGKEIKEEVG